MKIIFRIPKYEKYVNLIILVSISFVYYSFFYDKGFNLADEGNFLYIIERLQSGENLYSDIQEFYAPLWYLPFNYLLILFPGHDFIIIRIAWYTLAALTGILSYLILNNYIKNMPCLLVASLIILCPAPIHKILIPFCSLMLIWVFGWNIPRNYFSPWQSFFIGILSGICLLIKLELGLSAAIAFIFLLFFCCNFNVFSLRHAFRLLLFYFLPLIVVGLVFIYFYGIDVAKKSIINLSNFIIYCFKLVISSPYQLLNKDDFTLAPPSLKLLAIDSGVNTFAWEYYLFVLLISYIVISLIAVFFKKNKYSSDINQKFYAIFIMSAFIVTSSTLFSFISFRPDQPHYMQLYSIITVIFIISLNFFIKFFKKNTFLYILNVCMISIFIISNLLTVRYEINNKINDYKIQSYLYSDDKVLNIYLDKQNFELISVVIPLIKRVTTESDEILAYPYAPGFFAISGRKNASKFTYFDNTYLLSGNDFIKNELLMIANKKPKVIIIQPNVAINGTIESRFPIWAHEIMDYILAHYIKAISLHGVDVYIASEVYKLYNF